MLWRAREVRVWVLLICGTLFLKGNMSAMSSGIAAGSAGEQVALAELANIASQVQADAVTFKVLATVSLFFLSKIRFERLYHLPVILADQERTRIIPAADSHPLNVCIQAISYAEDTIRHFAHTRVWRDMEIFMRDKRIAETAQAEAYFNIQQLLSLLVSCPCGGEAERSFPLSLCQDEGCERCRRGRQDGEGHAGAGNATRCFDDFVGFCGWTGTGFSGEREVGVTTRLQKRQGKQRQEQACIARLTSPQLLPGYRARVIALLDPLVKRCGFLASFNNARKQALLGELAEFGRDLGRVPRADVLEYWFRLCAASFGSARQQTVSDFMAEFHQEITRYQLFEPLPAPPQVAHA